MCIENFFQEFQYIILCLGEENNGIRPDIVLGKKTMGLDQIFLLYNLQFLEVIASIVGFC